ncbi:MAG TPA: hypothetical protein PK006_13505 [Saprospiraceae bacterium]|nr:hypothetical protein [Saprospiraceae bacterium]
MIKYYIVKKKVKSNILKPSDIISIQEFENLIEFNKDFIWNEDAFPDELNKKRKVKAYLDFDKEDEKSFVQIIAPFSGFITVYFDFKVDRVKLMKLIDFAESIDCNLWQYKPKQLIIDKEFAENYGKRKKKESD